MLWVSGLLKGQGMHQPGSAKAGPAWGNLGGCLLHTWGEVLQWPARATSLGGSHGQWWETCWISGLHPGCSCPEDLETNSGIRIFMYDTCSKLNSVFSLFTFPQPHALPISAWENISNRALMYFLSWKSLSSCWQKVGKWSCPYWEWEVFKPQSTTLGLFQQLCLNTGLRVLPRALWECHHFSSVHERTAGWGQKPNTRQKSWSLTKEQNSPFSGAAPHCSKMNRNSWQELSWVSLHEIVQTGPFILEVSNRSNPALLFVLKKQIFPSFTSFWLKFWTEAITEMWGGRAEPVLLLSVVPHSSCCPEVAAMP